MQHGFRHGLRLLAAVAAVAATSAVLCAAQAALAQAFPSKPIRISVPYPAGGTTDLMARSGKTTGAISSPLPVLSAARPCARCRCRRSMRSVRLVTPRSTKRRVISVVCISIR